jgi:hypothetical protein
MSVNRDLEVYGSRTYHSYHLVQHLGYNGECEVADALLVVARRENVRFSGKVRDLGPTLQGLAYHHIIEAVQSYLQHSTQNNTQKWLQDLLLCALRAN